MSKGQQQYLEGVVLVARKHRQQMKRSSMQRQNGIKISQLGDAFGIVELVITGGSRIIERHLAWSRGLGGFLAGRGSSSAFSCILSLSVRLISCKLCKHLLTFALQQLFQRFPALEEVHINNISETEKGIPACFCYYRSGYAAGLQVGPEPDEDRQCRQDNPQGRYWFRRKKNG